MSERRSGSHTTATIPANRISVVGITPNTVRVSASDKPSLTLPPGPGRTSSAMPKYTALVASVAMMGCSRPMTTSAAFSAPAARPVASTQRMPKTTPSGVPLTSTDDTQHDRIITMPTDRSSPRVMTGKVCAMATRASSTALLEAVVMMLALIARGCSCRNTLNIMANTPSATRGKAFCRR